MQAAPPPTSTILRALVYKAKRLKDENVSVNTRIGVGVWSSALLGVLSTAFA